jgi:outer membrane protein W
MSRHSVLAFALLILSAIPAFAQKKGDVAVSVMATNFAATYSERLGTDVDGGVALGLSYWFNPRWSAELLASSQKTEFGGALIETHFPDGTILRSVDRISGTAYPFDLLARYHFVNDSRWKPYIGFGAHYVKRPDFKSDSGLPVNRVDLEANQSSAVVNGGTLFLFTPRLGLRVDGKFLLRGDNPQWDDNFKASVGLSFKF